MGTDSETTGAAGAADARSATRGRAAMTAAIAAVAALFLLILALCTTFLTDTDLYWHLATGDLILRTGHVPRAEPFSFTVLGHRWVDVHWLYQIGLSFLYGLGGTRALELLRSAVILCVFAFLFRRSRRAVSTTTVVVVLLLATLACQERFLLRPEIVSWALLLAVLSLLEKALDAEGRPARARILFIALPALQILWVNVQGLFILEPVCIALALLAAIVEFALARNEPAVRHDADRPIDFLLALAAASVAALVNPYGAAALRLPFDQFFVHLGGTSLLSRTIAEFQPPLSGYLVTPSIVAFVALAAATLLAIVADFPRVRWFDLLVTVATLVVALRARRNIPLFALAAAPVLARHAGALLAPARARIERFASFASVSRTRARAWSGVAAPALLAAGMLVLISAVVTNRFFMVQPTERWFGSGEIPDYFPDESARFVAAVGIPGNVFHSLSVGGYLIEAWRGERGVFIDGRNDPYLDDVLPAYLRAVADPSSFEEVARRYQVTAVLWPHQRALEGKTLLSYLAHGHGWVLVHLDPAAAVYLRADLLSPARLAEDPFPAGRDRRAHYEDLARLLDERPFHGPPIREIGLAEFFSVSGDTAGAEYFYARALGRLPHSAAVLYGYALALERRGRAQEARAAYARAVAADGGYLPARAALGSFLLEEGRLKDAEENLDAAYRGGERSARLLDARARLFEQKGDLPRAIASYGEALRGSPRDTGLLRALGLFYVRRDEPSSALTFYTPASQIDPDDANIPREMAALLVRLGRASAALDVERDAAGRARDRLAGGATGDWTGGAGAREDDRRLLLFAADLETRWGDRARATEYLEALRKSKLAGDQ
jgi:tetratricopeptide (TPR) repeat protein